MVVLAGARARLLHPGGVSTVVAPGQPIVGVAPSNLLPGQSAQVRLVFSARRKPPFQLRLVEVPLTDGEFLSP